MNVRIKFTGEFTVRNINRMPPAEDVRTELESILNDAVWGECVVTNFEQEYFEDED